MHPHEALNEGERKREKEKDMAAWLLPGLVEERFIVDMWRAGPCGVEREEEMGRARVPGAASRRPKGTK